MSDEENAALVLKTGVEQVFAPLHRLLDQLLGPAATEGLSLGDSVKLWRLKRQTRLLQEVKRIVEECDGEIKTVATRLFFPILDNASIEDDDEMQTRWAALLANEALNSGSVHPSFIEILKQMSPADATMLDRLFDFCEIHGNPIQWWSFGPVYDDEGEKEAVGNLVRLGLIELDYDLEKGHTSLKLFGPNAQLLSEPTLREKNRLSDVAVRFVKACRAPRVESKASE